MAEATLEVTLTLGTKMGDIANGTVKVPLTLNAGPIKDGHLPVTVDHEALQSRITSAMEAFARVAEA